MDEWLAKLESGDPVRAWDAFLDRYRNLILATLRRYVDDPDDLMDAFVEVCVTLRADDLSRLRRFVREQTRGARVSTWLVAVTRNRAIDWVRKRDGRIRPSAAVAALPPLQQRIAEYVVLQGCSHIEAFERLRTNDGHPLTFPAFLQALAATYRALEHAPGHRAARDVLGPPWPSEPATDPADVPSETPALLAAALRTLPADVQAAVQLFVVDEMPAERVARAVRWPNAKAVYNRVYRALADLRVELERRGVTREDVRPG